MLAEKKVDAITGFSFSMFLNLVRLGVPEEDISVMLMANNGLKLYGNAIIVNKDFASENPRKVSAFLKAVGCDHHFLSVNARLQNAPLQKHKSEAKNHNPHTRVSFHQRTQNRQKQNDQLMKNLARYNII